MSTPRHVVFGTGAIGLATMEALRRRGETVRMVNRSGAAPVSDDVEVLGGDASDPAFTTAAADGAQVVYQTLNPPYHQWVELFPALQASVPTVRELLELQYEFQEPFVIDSTKIATKLDVHATPLDQALADTLATYPTKPS